MNIGRFNVDVLHECSIFKDGGLEFAGIPKEEWKNFAIADKHNKIPVGINMLLVRSPKANIIVDAGIGSKLNADEHERLGVKEILNINKLLEPFGITSSQIDYVILTHLHAEHCGGSTCLHGDNIVPTFKNACYIVQKDEWESISQSNLSYSEYSVKNYLPLLESEQIRSISGNIELLPGFFVELTGGHTAGHQIVYIEDTLEDVMYFGDIIPTALHLAANRRSSFDFMPYETVALRNRLLCKAAQRNCLVAFSHDLSGKFYRILDENNIFKAVEAV